ncbi:MAG TPA: hypothetical protein VFE25_02150 [Opitutaceae bacterium]|nr:hypothetical protein [Opitutaceae bacterium]
MDFSNTRNSVATTDLTTEAVQDEKPMLKDWVVSTLGGLKQR